MPLIEPLLIPCPVFQVGPRGFDIKLPGGASISVQSADMWTTDPEICRQLLGQLQSYMAPMAPLFNIVGAVLCLKDIVTVIPETITTLDFQKLNDTFERCLPIIESLLSLIPAISAPAMICSTLDVLICVLNGAITQLELVIQQQVAVEALQAKSTGPQDPLFGIIACETHFNGVRMCAINESLGPLNNIIQLLNLFIQMIGGDPLPSFGEAAASATLMIDQLRTFIVPMKVARQALGCSALVAVPRC